MRNLNFVFIPAILLHVFFLSCDGKQHQSQMQNRPYAVWMAESEIARYPEAWMTENATQIKWGYHIGVLTKAMIDLWKHTGEQAYFDYAYQYADTMITTSGTIRLYPYYAFNIDHINPGKTLFDLYSEKGETRFKTAMDTLRKQMAEHPRTSEGGFWHKQRYPWQMWLDGLYMGAPFLARYAKEFNEPALFDDVVKQAVLMAKNTYDTASGLYYHAWDESRQQSWADEKTGQSPNFWGRGVGWFGMALVDILDFLPDKHPGKQTIIQIIRQTADGIIRWQDEDTGVWYQILDQGDREGNYLESTASSMFAYFLLKSIQRGYLDTSYLESAKKAYRGIIDTFIVENSDGTITMIQSCAGAGLGGDPYRDGSFEYYIGTAISENDPKATGPFIMASIEYESLMNSR
jgi:unsaturated rhamnogalacturonyl hydrolase